MTSRESASVEGVGVGVEVIGKAQTEPQPSRPIQWYSFIEMMLFCGMLRCGGGSRSLSKPLILAGGRTMVWRTF